MLFPGSKPKRRDRVGGTRRSVKMKGHKEHWQLVRFPLIICPFISLRSRYISWITLITHFIPFFGRAQRAALHFYRNIEISDDQLRPIARYTIYFDLSSLTPIKRTSELRMLEQYVFYP